MTRSIQARVLIVAAILVATLVMLRTVSHGEEVPIHQPLANFPLSFGPWHGEGHPFAGRIIHAVGVDDYINRTYDDGHGAEIEVYIGYYQSQATGDLIHSPKNCLPGAGWEPVSAERAKIQVSSSALIPVNEYVIQKGLDRLLVFYWYQEQGRAIASEYAGKFWMVVDALTRNRTDGALIRLSMPVGTNLSETRAQMVRFAQDCFPLLQLYLPK